MEEKYILCAKYIHLSDLRNVPKLNNVLKFFSNWSSHLSRLVPHSLTYHLMFHLKLLPTQDQIKRTAALPEYIVETFDKM